MMIYDTSLTIVMILAISDMAIYIRIFTISCANFWSGMWQRQVLLFTHRYVGDVCEIMKGMEQIGLTMQKMTTNSHEVRYENFSFKAKILKNTLLNGALRKDASPEDTWTCGVLTSLCANRRCVPSP